MLYLPNDLVLCSHTNVLELPEYISHDLNCAQLTWLPSLSLSSSFESHTYLTRQVSSALMPAIAQARNCIIQACSHSTLSQHASALYLGHISNIWPHANHNGIALCHTLIVLVSEGCADTFPIYAGALSPSVGRLQHKLDGNKDADPEGANLSYVQDSLRQPSSALLHASHHCSCACMATHALSACSSPLPPQGSMRHSPAQLCRQA